MAWRRVSISCLIGLTALCALGARADIVGQPLPLDLTVGDAEKYRAIFAAARAGESAKADRLLNEVSDPSLKGYALAEQYLSHSGKRVPVSTLVGWLENYRELGIADRIYRLAVKRSTRKKRHHHRVVYYAVVTNIPAPAAMPRLRGGGYEDVNLPDPPISSDAARAAQGPIIAAIKSDAPDQAMAVLQPLVESGNAPAYDIARLKQRVAAPTSRRAWTCRPTISRRTQPMPNGMQRRFSIGMPAWPHSVLECLQNPPSILKRWRRSARSRTGFAAAPRSGPHGRTCDRAIRRA
jgi:hypothetical protein